MGNIFFKKTSEIVKLFKKFQNKLEENPINFKRKSSIVHISMIKQI